MDRRRFFRNGSLAALGAGLISRAGFAQQGSDFLSKGKKAKSIIFMVSDGMSSGTLNMADVYLNRAHGRSSAWMQLYKDRRVARALMDTASASSIVTDSAAGSSSWGGGVRVPNGSLNVGANGEHYMPILQKFKKSGKKVGCVTTVPITHATPAGFCVNVESRGDQSEIAELYLQLDFDVMMGGGHKYFAPDTRKDKKDLYAAFSSKGWAIARTRGQMMSADAKKPVLGVFADDALPYTVDRNSDAALQQQTPTLAEMALKAIDLMKSHPAGFALQVEGGKVDWGAHANDIGALLYDQAAFDEAVGAVIDFAQKDGETLVIITTDHGNSNPGIIYGKHANENFDSLQHYAHSNEWVLNSIHPDTSAARVKDLIASAHNIALTDEEANAILGYYTGLEKGENGLYNYNKLPFRAYAEIQKKHNSVGWISMDHSGDYVELAAFGPGSELLRPFVKNTDLHYLMLAAAEIENKF
jgi:alkaline phosphatase